MESEIIKRILNGDVYALISADTGIAVSTIKKIKKRQYEALAQAKKEGQLSIAEQYRLINCRIIRKLNAAVTEYPEPGKDLTVSELLGIIRITHKHSLIKSPPYRPPTPREKELLKYL